MASFATHGRRVGGELSHAILEFAMMRIDVTRGATPVFEMEWQYLIGTPCVAFFVAADARDHGVRPLQGEPRFAVHGDRKFRPVKIDDAVTVLATIRVRSLGELPRMGVLVAVLALRKFDFIHRIFARRHVAFCTSHAGMFSEERVGGAGVFFHPE